MPLTSCAFIMDRQTLVTASTDFTYMFSKMSDFSVQKSLMKLLTQFGVLLICLIILADYLY